MYSDSNRLYFKDYRLFITPDALQLLQQAGLHKDVIDAAQNGLVMDNGQHLPDINAAFNQVMARITTNLNSGIATAS